MATKGPNRPKPLSLKEAAKAAKRNAKSGAATTNVPDPAEAANQRGAAKLEEIAAGGGGASQGAGSGAPAPKAKPAKKPAAKKARPKKRNENPAPDEETEMDTSGTSADDNMDDVPEVPAPPATPAPPKKQPFFAPVSGPARAMMDGGRKVVSNIPNLAYNLGALGLAGGAGMAGLGLAARGAKFGIRELQKALADERPQQQAPQPMQPAMQPAPQPQESQPLDYGEELRRGLQEMNRMRGKNTSSSSIIRNLQARKYS